MKIQNYEVIAHRGHGSEPENTMRAFRKGHEVGADRVEFDIQKTADGDYVVIHDPTVDRTTNGKGKVCDFTTADIEQLDAGKGEHLPLFTEVIDWAVKNDVALDIEVKHPEVGDEAPLARLIQSSGLRNPWVMSFDGAFVERFEKCAGEITTGVLIHERPLFDQAVRGAGFGLATGLGAALGAGLSALPFVGAVAAGMVGGAALGYGLTMSALRRKGMRQDVDVVIPGKRILNKKTVERAHALGKQVAVYTIDDSRKGQKLAQWGIDAVITNFPERHL